MPMARHRCFRVEPPDGSPKIAAERLGISLDDFNAVLPNLYERGFPKPDPDTGNFDLSGDVRALRASQLARDASGAAWFTERGKTGKPVGGALNDRAIAAMQAYLEKLGIESSWRSLHLPQQERYALQQGHAWR
jgi:hypothetical protein